MNEVFSRFLVDAKLTGTESPVVTTTCTRINLLRLFDRLGYREGAEIGVWTGQFSEWMCKLIPGLHLTCVDPWQEYPAYKEKKNQQHRLDYAYGAARDRLTPFNCTFLRMTSEAGAAEVPDSSLDFVYVDGNHAKAFARQDLELWSPKVRSGGIVAGHDYELTPKHAHVEVKSAVDEFVRDHQIPMFYVLDAEKAASYFWVQP